MWWADVILSPLPIPTPQSNSPASARSNSAETCRAEEGIPEHVPESRKCHPHVPPGRERYIKWTGQLAAWEAHNQFPAFPGSLKKAYDTKPFFRVHGTDTAVLSAQSTEY